MNHIKPNESVFQIYLSELELELPRQLHDCRNSLCELFSDYEYHFFNLVTLREFISLNFDGDVLAAYDSLRPFAYKADLGRYCLLHAFGGWYADVTLKVMNGVRMLRDVSLVYFYDYGNGAFQSSHYCQNGLLYVQKGHPLMREAIERIIKNCKDKYYGPTCLCPTGPGLLGELLVKYVPARGIHHGYFMPLTPDHRLKNRAYVGPSGEIVALHKTAWCPQATEGRLDAFGAKGVNSYTKMWAAKEVYT